MRLVGQTGAHTDKATTPQRPNLERRRLRISITATSATVYFTTVHVQNSQSQRLTG